MINKKTSIRALLGFASLLLVGMVNAVSPNAIATSITLTFVNADLGDDAKYAAIVTDLESGIRIVERNPLEPLRASDSTSLLTAAAALDVLGGDHRFYTTVSSTTTIDEFGTLDGPLIIRGEGDPSLGPLLQVDQSDTLAVLESWAKQLRKSGLRRVSGPVIADGGFFRYDPEPDNSPPATSLAFNQNAIQVTVEGRGRIGGRAKIRSIDPRLKTLKFKSYVEITESGSNDITFIKTAPDEVAVNGRIAKGDVVTARYRPVDPELFIATAFQEQLKREGIRVEQAPVGNRNYAAILPPPSEREILVQHFSAPLSEMVPLLVQNREPVSSNMIARRVAIELAQPSHSIGAADALMDWASTHRVDRPGFVLFDPNGIEEPNRIPALVLSETMEKFWDHRAFGHLLSNSLVRKTRQLQATQFEIAQGDFGSQGETSEFFGIYKSENGKEYSIAIILNGRSKSNTDSVLADMLRFLIPSLDTIP